MNVINIAPHTYRFSFVAKNAINQSLINNALTIGNYASEIYTRDGKSYALVKTVKKVFDGTENWQYYGNEETFPNSAAFYLLEPDILTGHTENIALCNYFNVVDETTYNSADYDCMTVRGYVPVFSARFNVSILKSRLSTVDVAGFKAYLAARYAAGNPVSVHYVSNTPEEVEIEPLTNMETFYPYTKIASSADGVPIAIMAEVRELGNRAHITAKIIDENGNRLVDENGNYICGSY